jgi:hypothetical protein
VAKLLCDGLLFGGDCDVPTGVAICPECGDQLHAESQEFEVESGAPTIGGLYIYCNSDPFSQRHQHRQCDWQPVMTACQQHFGAVDT